MAQYGGAPLMQRHGGLGELRAVDLDHGHDHDHGPKPLAYAVAVPGTPSMGLPLPSGARGARPRVFLRRPLKPLADALRVIAGDPTMRKILVFLVLNLSFCGVEALYGLITNSLGLFTDAVHMMFDSTAIAMGLAASVVGKWGKDERWSFGCVEVLGSFWDAEAGYVEPGLVAEVSSRSLASRKSGV